MVWNTLLAIFHIVSFEDSMKQALRYIPDFGLASAWLGSARVRRALHVGNLSMAWGGAAALGDQVCSALAPPLGRLPRPSLVRQYALPAVSIPPCCSTA